MEPSLEHVAVCTCGNLRITAKGDPDVVIACNCTDCQRRTGSPFGVGAYYPRASIVSIEGKSVSFERQSDAGRALSYEFCADCGASVYWTLDMRPGHIGIAAGCFTEPDFVRPARAVWAKNQYHWVEFPDDLPVFPEAAPEPGEPSA